MLLRQPMRHVPFSVLPSTTQRAVLINTNKSSSRSRWVTAQVDNEDNGGGGNLGDDMLDFLYAGKKLRKWYGQEGQVLPNKPSDDESNSPLEKTEEDVGPSDQTCVLNVENSDMAEQVLLQLILARSSTRILVEDAAQAKKAYGDYVDVVDSSRQDAKSLQRALRRAKALVLCSKVSSDVIRAARSAGVPHIVLLSAVGAPPPSLFARLLGDGEATVLQDPQREGAVVQSGVPYTIVRVGTLTDAEGGSSELRVEVGDGPGDGEIPKEDAALVVTQAALRDVESIEASLAFRVAARGPGRPPRNWDALMTEPARR